MPVFCHIQGILAPTHLGEDLCTWKLCTSIWGVMGTQHVRQVLTYAHYGCVTMSKFEMESLTSQGNQALFKAQKKTGYVPFPPPPQAQWWGHSLWKPEILCSRPPSQNGNEQSRPRLAFMIFSSSDLLIYQLEKWTEGYHRGKFHPDRNLLWVKGGEEGLESKSSGNSEKLGKRRSLFDTFFCCCQFVQLHSHIVTHRCLGVEFPWVCKCQKCLIDDLGKSHLDDHKIIECHPLSLC